MTSKQAKTISDDKKQQDLHVFPIHKDVPCVWHAVVKRTKLIGFDVGSAQPDIIPIILWSRSASDCENVKRVLLGVCLRWALIRPPRIGDTKPKLLQYAKRGVFKISPFIGKDFRVSAWESVISGGGRKAYTIAYLSPMGLIYPRDMSSAWTSTSLTPPLVARPLWRRQLTDGLSCRDLAYRGLSHVECQWGDPGRTLSTHRPSSPYPQPKPDLTTGPPSPES